MDYKELRTILSHYLWYAMENDLKLITAYFDTLIIYSIYEEQQYEYVKKAGKLFCSELRFEIFNGFPAMDDDTKMKTIHMVFGAIYNRFHPVRNAIETMDSIEDFRQWIKTTKL